MEKYTDYVNDLFTPDYMYDDSNTLVFPQLERFDDDPNTLNITVRQSRQSGVARATCPD